MNIPKLIESIIENKTQNSVMFTAYDITVEARSQTTHRVSHNDVKQILQDSYAGYAYDRTLRTVNNFTAFVYHPIGADADNYASGSAPVAVSAPASVSDTSKPTTTRTRSFRDTLIRDRYGRIRVPAHVTRDMGQDVLYIQQTPSGVIVSKKDGTPYKVDDYGNIRLTLRGSLRTHARFHVEIGSDECVLKPN